MSMNPVEFQEIGKGWYRREATSHGTCSRGVSEDIPMRRTVALRERGRLAALLNSILRAARRRGTWQEPDARNLRTWRQLVLGVLVTRSTRLLSLARAVLPERRARRVKTAALGLGYFLARADFPIGGLSRRLLLAIARALPAERLVRYRGKGLLG